MNLDVGRIQNVTAENEFLSENSLYEFVDSADRKEYFELIFECESVVSF